MVFWLVFDTKSISQWCMWQMAIRLVGDPRNRWHVWKSAIKDTGYFSSPSIHPHWFSNSQDNLAPLFMIAIEPLSLQKLKWEVFGRAGRTEVILRLHFVETGMKIRLSPRCLKKCQESFLQNLVRADPVIGKKHTHRRYWPWCSVAT